MADKLNISIYGGIHKLGDGTKLVLSTTGNARDMNEETFMDRVK